MNIANEVSVLAADYERLKEENRALHEAKILADFEVAQYKARCAKAEAAEKDALRLAADLRSILDHAANGMVAGLNRIHSRSQERKPDNIVDAEYTEPPLFLQKANGKDHSESFQ